MKIRIVCNTCDQEIGQLEKLQITNDDEQFYAENVSCDFGHIGAKLILVSPVEEPPAEVPESEVPNKEPSGFIANIYNGILNWFS